MDISEKLFEYAMKQLDASNIPSNHWTMGGGTILKFFYQHRESKDIDIFIDNPQFLGMLSPRINDAVEDTLKDYSEASNYIKMSFHEGAVDFIVAPRITSFVPIKHHYFERSVMLDDPVEIVAKKIFYRAEGFKPRDVFDLAIVSGDRREDMLRAVGNMADKIRILEKNLKDIKNNNTYEKFVASGDIIILPGGEYIRGKEIQACEDFIVSAQERIRKNLEKEVAE